MSEYICPNCRQPIYDDEALLCLYCGESLKRELGVIGRMKHMNPRILSIILIIILLSFLSLVIR